MGLVLQLALIAMRMRAQQSASRVAATSGIVLLALLFALFGLAGFTAAAWIALAHELGAIRTALIMGGAGFVAAAVLLLIAKSRSRRRVLAAPVLPDMAAMLKQTMATSGAPVVWAPLIGAALIGLLIGRGGGKNDD